MSDLVAKARAIADQAHDKQEAKRAANRAAMPRLTACLDEIRKFDPRARVVKVYPAAKA